MIVLKTPKTKEEFAAYYCLRYHVLREPWGQPRGTEKDDYEPISQHFMAVDDQTGEVVGTARLMEKEPGAGQLSLMAVLPARQGEGIGRILMNRVEEAAREQGFKTLGIFTLLMSTGFYEKCGFHTTGVPIHISGATQLVWMEKEL